MSELLPQTFRNRFAFLGGGSLLIVLLGVAAFSPALHSRPFDTDNLLALAIGREGNAWHLFTSSFVASLPAYRPVPFLTLIAEYRLVGHAPWHFFAVNLGFALLMGIAAFALAWCVTRNRLAGLFCGAVVLLDPRVNEALFWIGERQSTMAVILTAIALGVAWRMPVRSSRPWLALVVGLMLLAAALSKEYALAAAPAVAIVAVGGGGRRRAPLVVASAGSLLAYGIMRFVVAGGAGGSYCESEGLWTHERYVCLRAPRQAGYTLIDGWDKLGQEAWNVVASFVSTAFYFVFSSDGRLAHETMARRVYAGPHGTLWLTVDIVFFTGLALLATYAWATSPRAALPFLALVVGNACLSFLVFRMRDQLIGVLGLDVSAAIGFVSLMERVQRMSPALVRRVSIGAALFVALWLGWQVTQHRDTQNAQLDDTMRNEAPRLCAHAGAIPAGRYVPPALIRELKEYYGMTNPTCNGKAR